MKRILFTLLLFKCSLIYSQIPEFVKDSIKFQKNYCSILIDSAKLNRYREGNASGAILYETTSVSFDNTSLLSASSYVRIRDNSPATLTLNGVPINQHIPPISQFNIENIEIYKTSHNTGTNFLFGTVNLTTVKPHFNKPYTVIYEGGINVGRHSPMILSKSLGLTLSSNVSFEKGSEKSATRVAFSNSLLPGNESLIYNSLSIDKLNRLSSNLLINSSIYLTQGTYLVRLDIDEKKTYFPFLLFGNIALDYEISDKLSLNTNIATMLSKMGNGDLDPKNSTPLFGNISLKRKSKIKINNFFETALGYSYQINKTNPNFEGDPSMNRFIFQGSPTPSFVSQSVYGSFNYSYSKIIYIKASVCNEFYKDDYSSLDYFIIPTTEFQLDLFHLFNTHSARNSLIIFANYTYSDRQSSYINIMNKFESGVDLTFISNRIGLKASYFKYNSKINFGAINPDNWGVGYTPPAIYGRFDEGVELQNSIKVVDSKNLKWLIKNDFIWFNSNSHTTSENYEDYSWLLKTHLPKYRYSITSDLAFKNFSFGFIVERIKDQPTNVFPLELVLPDKGISDIIAIRQLNFTYKKDSPNLKNVKSVSFSVYLKNYNLYTNPSEYKNPSYLLWDQTYGVSCSRVFGINLQLRF